MFWNNLYYVFFLVWLILKSNYIIFSSIYYFEGTNIIFLISSNLPTRRRLLKSFKIKSINSSSIIFPVAGFILSKINNVNSCLYTNLSLSNSRFHVHSSIEIFNLIFIFPFSIVGKDLHKVIFSNWYSIFHNNQIPSWIYWKGLYISLTLVNEKDILEIKIIFLTNYIKEHIF